MSKHKPGQTRGAGDNSLADLAARISEAHRQAMRHAGEAMAQAIACGEMLLEAKAKVPHGQWLPWLRGNIAFGERSAQGYMRLAQRADRIDIAGLSLRDALKRLAAPRRHWREALDAELELWIAHAETLEIGRPEDPRDWSHQDAQNCAVIIRGFDSILHRYGICEPDDCTVCDYERDEILHRDGKCDPNDCLLCYREREANTQRVADSGEVSP